MGQPVFSLISRDGLTWLESAPLRREHWALHAFSTRRLPKSVPPVAWLNLGFTPGADHARVESNRELFLRVLGAKSYTVASLRQTHSANVFYVTRGASGALDYWPSGVAHGMPVRDTPPAGDAMLTDQPGILLSVRVADCLPILFADPRKRAVAVVHAGWRGALARVISKAAGEMVHLFGSDPQTCLAALGPSIRACCYAVGEEVVEAFMGRFTRPAEFFRWATGSADALEESDPRPFPGQQPPGHGGDPDSSGQAARATSVPRPGRGPGARCVAFLDLVAVAREELLSAGFHPRHIHVAEFCTACRPDLFFSYRKEGKGTGRLMGVIAIRPEAASAGPIS